MKVSFEFVGSVVIVVWRKGRGGGSGLTSVHCCAVGKKGMTTAVAIFNGFDIPILAHFHKSLPYLVPDQYITILKYRYGLL